MSKALDALEQTAARFGPVTPIVSETVASTDTRFGKAHDFMREMERLCDRRVISTVAGAEPIGPKGLLDVLVICPCTGNTLAKLAHGVTDSSVTMAAKAHLRNGRPLVLALATNDSGILEPSQKVLMDTVWRERKAFPALLPHPYDILFSFPEGAIQAAGADRAEYVPRLASLADSAG